MYPIRWVESSFHLRPKEVRAIWVHVIWRYLL